MIKFFTNRELSQNLEINLARWKRWSREFLPPDPLGGLQSGYARQFNPNEAFVVFLGGHLVADLKFTIPESKQILKDIRNWLRETGFYFDSKAHVESLSGENSGIKKYIIFIFRHIEEQNKETQFSYIIRGVFSNRPVDDKGNQVMEERYIETSIGSATVDPKKLGKKSARVLSISGALEHFVKKLKLGKG
jgi:hypothetical protein